MVCYTLKFESVDKKCPKTADTLRRFIFIDKRNPYTHPVRTSPGVLCSKMVRQSEKV